MKNRINYFLLLNLLIFFPTLVFASETCKSDYSALVVEEKTGNILFEKHPDQVIYPASLTKLMTLYLTFEALKRGKLDMKQNLIASTRAEQISAVNKSNTMHLKSGDNISVENAIKGSIIKSFNETAVILGEALAGDEWSFARLMNKKAEELGMSFSNFRNASGLHDVGQYTTNDDLAKLALAIKEDFPEYYYLFALREFKYAGQKYVTHNHFLVNYKGATGMKTGFTNMAGYNLVAAAQRKDNDVVLVITGCESFVKRDKTAQHLMDLAFQEL